jgi:2-hydroxy-3-keto-5-methylthiopentenyl-1-phosphate phosphatase
VENALVSDFDGTITRRDFYALIADRYMPRSEPDYLELYRAGKLSHFDAMASYFAHAPTDEASLALLLKDTEPDPAFQSTVARLHQASWDLIIVSAGSSWYIDRILAACGVNAAVHSNPGHPRTGRGLVIEKPLGSPFLSTEVGIDKAAVVREALGRYKRVAFAGDGPPDVEPALLVDPELRFARDYLARELQRRGEVFQPFERWSDVVLAILPGETGSDSVKLFGA